MDFFLPQSHRDTENRRGRKKKMNEAQTRLEDGDFEVEEFLGVLAEVADQQT
jgi:hypothetical protein